MQDLINRRAIHTPVQCAFAKDEARDVLRGTRVDGLESNDETVLAAHVADLKAASAEALSRMNKSCKRHSTRCTQRACVRRKDVTNGVLLRRLGQVLNAKS